MVGTASAIEDTGKQSYLAKGQPEMKMKTRMWLGPPGTFGLLFVSAAQAATVVALGASNTFGKGVSRSQAYPAQLEALLRTKGLNARVINAGINGDATGGMLARLDLVVPKGASVVILQPGGNDRRKFAPDKTSEIQARLATMGIKVVLLPNGMLDSRLLVFPTAQATLIDSWFAAGLCGTGSGDMEVRELRVPVTRSVSLVTDRPVEGGPLYVFPVFGLLALGIGAVALGIARAAITDLVALAGGKKPQGSTRTLAERATAQTALAEAEARLRAARAFFYEAVGEAWARATGAGDISLGERAALRLAATHATRVAADVARTAYDLGGGSSVHLSSPLQRRFRDAHVATQHVLVSPATLELAGRVLMGLPTDATML